MSGRAADAVTPPRTSSPKLWLAKRIWPDRTEPYSLARHFDVTTIPVHCLADIRALLDRLILDPRSCVVRGELIEPDLNKHVRRLLYPDGRTGDAATFRDVPRRWVALDMEGVQIAPLRSRRPMSPDARAWPSRHCPPPSTACIASRKRVPRTGLSRTSGYGFGSGSLRPTAGDELERWLAGSPADPAVFRARAADLHRPAVVHGRRGRSHTRPAGRAAGA